MKPLLPEKCNEIYYFPVIDFIGSVLRAYEMDGAYGLIFGREIAPIYTCMGHLSFDSDCRKLV